MRPLPARLLSAFVARRQPGMPSPLAVALGYREAAVLFPGWSRYSPCVIHLGLADEVVSQRLDAALASLTVLAPDLDLRLTRAPGQALAAAVAAGDLDLAILAEADLAANDLSKALIFEPLAAGERLHALRRAVRNPHLRAVVAALGQALSGRARP